jgi:hypothetical protein
VPAEVAAVSPQETGKGHAAKPMDCYVIDSLLRLFKERQGLIGPTFYPKNW